MHDWEKRAKALDLFLEGKSYAEIARILEMSRQNAYIVCQKAGHRLAYRVFRGVPWRP